MGNWDDPQEDIYMALRQDSLENSRLSNYVLNSSELPAIKKNQLVQTGQYSIKQEALMKKKVKREMEEA